MVVLLAVLAHLQVALLALLALLAARPAHQAVLLVRQELAVTINTFQAMLM